MLDRLSLCDITVITCMHMQRNKQKKTNRCRSGCTHDLQCGGHTWRRPYVRTAVQSQSHMHMCSLGSENVPQQTWASLYVARTDFI